MRKLLTLVLLPLLAISCDSANKQRPSAQYEEKKQSLGDMERSSPLKFLKINGDNHTNLVNQEVVTGTLSNSATLVTYKNIEVRVSFMDKGGSVIEKDIKIINEPIAPNSSNSFKIKMKRPKGTKSVVLDISGATAEK